MKSNGLTTLLNGALAVCLVASVFLCAQFFFLSRDFRQLSAQVAGINAWRNSVQAFASDCIAYSKQNPAIVPLLETIGVNKSGTNKSGK